MRKLLAGLALLGALAPTAQAQTQINLATQVRGGPIKLVDGTAAAPGYTFTSETGTGLYRSAANEASISLGGTQRYRFGAGSLTLIGGTPAITFSTNTSVQSEAANSLSLLNGTGAQSLRVYNTFTDALNYERGFTRWNANVFEVGNENAGTGLARGFGIVSQGVVNVAAGGANKLQISTGGNILFSNDNAQDIGALGATRPRNLYVGTQIVVADGSSAVPSYVFAGDTSLGFYRRGAGVVEFAQGSAGSVDFRGAVDATLPHSISLRSNGFVAWSADANPNMGAGTSAFIGSPGTNQFGVATVTSSNYQFRVVNFANAVNYVVVHGNATLGPPAVGVDGSDLNISLVLNSKGSGGVALATNGGATQQLLVTHTASAVNFVSVTGGATASQVNVGADGSDANINFRAYTKGTGQFEVITNGLSGSRQFVVGHTASAVNFVLVTGGATGVAPVLQAAGADTNVGFTIASKGTGVVAIGSSLSSALQVAGIASGVNFFQMNSAVTTGSPTLFSTGSDVNVGMNFTTKGTGPIRLQTGGGLQAAILDTASAVNFVQLNGGATGVDTVISAGGSDTNVGITLKTKGTSGFTFSTAGGGAPQFTIIHTASSVNYLQATGGATGAGAILSSQGSDPNVDLALVTKGTGAIAFSTGGSKQVQISNTTSAVNFLTFTGGATGTNSVGGLAVGGSDANISINYTTKAGGQHNFSIGSDTGVSFAIRSASATVVNQLAVRGAATGAAPTLTAEGSDTNVNMSLVAKGTGQITFASGGAAQAQINSIASAVNVVQISGAVTGSGPIVAAAGSDTNVDLNINSKGTGQVKTNGDVTVVGTLHAPVTQNSQSLAYTTVLSDAGKHIYHPSTDNNARTFTIAANASVAYPVGTMITFVNEVNTVTIAMGGTDTLVLAGAGTTGSRTLAANGVATAVKVGTTRWFIYGSGLT